MARPRSWRAPVFVCLWAVLALLGGCMTAPPSPSVTPSDRLPAAAPVEIPKSHTQATRAGSVGRALSQAAQRLSASQLKAPAAPLEGDGGWLIYRALNSARHSCRALPLSARDEQRASRELYGWFARQQQLQHFSRYLGDSLSLLPGDVLFFAEQAQALNQRRTREDWGRLALVVGVSREADGVVSYDLYHQSDERQHKISQRREETHYGYLSLRLEGLPIAARGRWCHGNNCDCSLPRQVAERYIDEPSKPAPRDDAGTAPKALFRQSGTASWYGPGFHGRTTASGERYDMHKMTAAHKQLPFGTQLRVTNLDNGLSVVVRITDRGPYVGKRIIDLSRKAAERLDMMGSGIADVLIEEMPPPWPVLDE